MSDTSTSAPSGATLEQLQSQAAHSRRIRPLDLQNEVEGANRVPLRADGESKMRRRESRLGLRSIFGRNRGSSDGDGGASAPTDAPRDYLSPRPGGLRASLAELSSNWPYGLHNGHHSQGQRSEITLPSFSLQSAKSPPPSRGDLKHKKSASVVRPQTFPRNSRGSVATWDPPPLFKAYPQAIRHAHLPACTISAEAVLRLHNHKNSISLSNQSSLTLGTMGSPSSSEKSEHRSRRKHRRNTSGSSSFKFEWTTKTYVLVTSGYLLQYAGDGSFDRLPERVLHLGKDSAAFASDVIPGRHWVLQVSSVAEPDGGPMNPTSSHVATSLFSRLPFRGQERTRPASNLLMVFESAEDMDSWIATLRREIEALGGKKNLSETGKPKTDNESQSQLRGQLSQRTLVMKDPARFSRVLSSHEDSQSAPWDQAAAAAAAAATGTGPDIQLDLAEPELSDTSAREQSFDDDTSTAASGISHDGRQLDGLRDSTHRLSFISSGQRTVITSAGSSPACSPVRDSFASQTSYNQEDWMLSPPPPPSDFLLPPPHEEEQQRPSAGPRLRPNAAAIDDRRQSMRTMNHLFELRVASAQAQAQAQSPPHVHQPHSTSYASQGHLELGPAFVPTPQATTPNFSVPQGVSKRYSLANRSTAAGAVEGVSVTVASPPRQPCVRRPPPTAISINARPLSFVQDQPSPLPTGPFDPLEGMVPEREGAISPSSSLSTTTAPDTPSMFSSSSWTHHMDAVENHLVPTRNSSLLQNRQSTTVQVTVTHCPRRHTSASTLRPSDIQIETTTTTHTIILPSILNNNKALPRPPTPVSVTVTSPRQPPPPLALREMKELRDIPPRSRSSLDNYGPPPTLMATQGERNGGRRRFSLYSQTAERPTSLLDYTPSLKPDFTRSSQHLRADSFSKGSSSLRSRSMSRLAPAVEVALPPPAPPPTCALPPIPRPRR